MRHRNVASFARRNVSLAALGVALAGLLEPITANAQGIPANLPASAPEATADVPELAPARSDAGKQNGGETEVIVTGSRIARRDLTSQTPIVTVGAETIASRGTPTIEDTLNQLPQFTPAAGSASSFNARGGQANLNLRALGSLRTLVLINSRRLQPANADGSADLNVIPAPLIESVETITGGASSVYGSDAIAGVVNIRLKERFHGIELGGQSNITDKGDAGIRTLSLIAGTDFAGGRGNVMVAGVYTERETVSFADRGFLSQQGLTPGFPGGLLSVDAANLPSQAAVNQIFARYGAAPGSVLRSTSFYFNDDGTVFRQAGGVVGFKGASVGDYSQVGNTLYSNTSANNFAQIPLQRYTAYGNAEFKVSDAAKLFVQGLYTRYTALTSGPPAASNSTVRPLTLSPGNPFIPADLRTLLASRANPNGNFIIVKRFDLLGPRQERDEYDMYQLTAGGSGRLGIGNLRWNGYASTGETKYTSNQLNFPSIVAVQQLVGAADGGRSLCTGGFNPFGNNPISQDCINFIARDVTNTTTLRQQVVEATIDGSIVKLPAGDLSFALGADYRRNTYSYNPDAQVQAGTLAAILPSQPSSGTVSAKEAYAELFVPVLRDLPLVHALNLNLSYRFSQYNISGSIHTYKASADWEPVSGVMVRGGYARATRAPSTAELFTALVQDQASIGTLGAVPGSDPCDVRGGYRRAGYPGAAQVRSLCLAQGVPANLIDTLNNPRNRVPTTSSGNLNLAPEVADTYSLGVVVTPKFDVPVLSRLAVSVDYYNIQIRRAIGSITAPLALSKCYNADGSNPTYDPSNLYCQLIKREVSSGLIENINTPRLNLGGYKTAGVDVSVNWPIGLDDLGIAPAGTVTLSGDINYLDKFEIQTLPDAPFVDYAGSILNTQVDIFSSARPTWKGTAAIRYGDGGFDIGGRWRYIGSMVNANGVGVVNNTLPRTASISYFDLDAGVRIGRRFDLRAGVTNLFDREPPESVPGTTSGYSYDLNTYDLIGRRLFVSFRARL